MYIHTYINVWIHSYIHVFIYKCVHMRVRACVCVCVFPRDDTRLLHITVPFAQSCTYPEFDFFFVHVQMVSHIYFNCMSRPLSHSRVTAERRFFFRGGLHRWCRAVISTACHGPFRTVLKPL